MYAIMKLEYEAPIYDDFHFGANFKRHIKMQIRLSYSRKKQNRGGGGRGLRKYLFEKTTWNFFVFYFTLGNSGQNKAPPLEIPQNCVTSLCYIPWKFRGQNPRHLEIPHDFFLITPGNSTSFLINYFGKAAKVS